MAKRKKKVWADSVGIPRGKLGDVIDGIRITEENRATVYEERRAGIQELLEYQHNNYTVKGTKSVIYGVRQPNTIEYAIFCENGFITNES